MAHNVIAIGHAAGCLISIKGGTYQVQKQQEVLEHALKLPKEVQTIPQNPESGYLLATVVRLPFSSNARYSSGLLQAIINQYHADDDVWNTEFLQVILSTSSGKWKLGARESGIIPERSAFISNRSLEKVAPGPYVIERTTGKLFAVRRLYQDGFQAFLYGAVPSLKNHGSYDVFTTCLDGCQTATISVPSRLYSIGDNRPLAGFRFAVKDTIDVKGLKTGCGSRAYYNLYPTKHKSASVIDKLLVAGAVLVGKVKVCQFADGERPVEWVDYSCPYSPRGDGYQQPSDLSTGSAVSVAAYSWVDFAVDTDTGGSIRELAGVQGIFGSRPSWGAVEADLIVPVSKHLDTVGVFARDAEIFKTVGETILTQPGPERPLQKHAATRNVGRLLYPIRSTGSQDSQWFPRPDDRGQRSDAEEDIEIFVRRAEDLWGVKREEFSIDELWEATRPEGQPARLDEALGTVYPVLTDCSVLRDFVDRFVVDYSKANNGRKPLINPAPRFWQPHQRGQNEELHDAALQTKEVFKIWAERNLFPPRDDGKETVMIYPHAMRLPMHIEPEERDGFPTYAFGYLIGCPDYTIPISEVAYHSVITEMEEYFPVAVSMLSSVGNDRFLFDLVKSMQDERIVQPVSTGRRIFNVEELGADKELVITSTSSEGCTARKVLPVTKVRSIKTERPEHHGSYISLWLSKFANSLPGIY